MERRHSGTGRLAGQAQAVQGCWTLGSQVEGPQRAGALGHSHARPDRPSADINECLRLPGPCAYQCHNLQGGFRCLCPPGQALLRDGKTCTPLEQSGPNVTTVSHRGPFASWPRPRAPIPSGSYHAWVSLRRGPGPLSSVGRAWCPPGYIRQSGVCTGNRPVGTRHCRRLRALPGPGAPRGQCGPCPEGGLCRQVCPGPI